MDIQSLNASGVSYLWSKIKTYIDNAIETIFLSRDKFGIPVNLEGSTINAGIGDVFIKTVTSDTSFTFIGVPENRTSSVALILTNGGFYNITWPTNVYWTFGQAPALSDNGTDVLIFLTPDGGTKWYGSLSVMNGINLP